MLETVDFRFAELFIAHNAPDNGKQKRAKPSRENGFHFILHFSFCFNFRLDFLLSQTDWIPLKVRTRQLCVALTNNSMLCCVCYGHVLCAVLYIWMMFASAHALIAFVRLGYGLYIGKFVFTDARGCVLAHSERTYICVYTAAEPLCTQLERVGGVLS